MKRLHLHVAGVAAILLVSAFARTHAGAAQQVNIEQATASSEMYESHLAGAYIYPAAYILDGDPKTAWVEGVAGSGIGESIEVKFSAPVTIDEIRIINGFARNETLYYNNNRIQDLQVSGGGTTTTFSLRDRELGRQKMPLGGKVTMQTVTLTIKSVHRGKYDDTCISDVQFLNDGQEIRIGNLKAFVKNREKESRRKTLEILHNPQQYFQDHYVNNSKSEINYSFYSEKTGISFFFWNYNEGKGAFTLLSDRDGKAEESGEFNIRGNQLALKRYWQYREISSSMIIKPAGPDAIVINGVKYLRKN